MKVRLLRHDAQKGALNMAIDEAILRVCAQGKVGPTLRFYRWRPPCLSLGYFQDARKEVNLEGLKELGIDLVRRPTGGKAVLHDDEVTYSVVVPERDMKGTVLETYHIISRALVKGLRLLGVPAEVMPLERGIGPRDERFRNPACFSAPSWYEVVALGKKIVGSAQCRKSGVLLQHGSIPLSFSPARLARCLYACTTPHLQRLEEFLSKKATSISEALGRTVQPEEVEDALIGGFRQELGWELEPDELTEEEIALVKQLSEEKYSSDNWTFERGTISDELY